MSAITALWVVSGEPPKIGDCVSAICGGGWPQPARQTQRAREEIGARGAHTFVPSGGRLINETV
jgi:hypothetical protein